jgi:hypothetical protein
MLLIFRLQLTVSEVICSKRYELRNPASTQASGQSNHSMHMFISLSIARWQDGELAKLCAFLAGSPARKPQFRSNFAKALAQWLTRTTEAAVRSSIESLAAGQWASANRSRPSLKANRRIVEVVHRASFERTCVLLVFRITLQRSMLGMLRFSAQRSGTLWRYRRQGTRKDQIRCADRRLMAGAVQPVHQSPLYDTTLEQLMNFTSEHA